jgi:hypothetical protein
VKAIKREFTLDNLLRRKLSRFNQDLQHAILSVEIKDVAIGPVEGV